VQEQLRYVTARPSLKNPKRWYWQRPGHPLIRLPNDAVQRFALADRLNRQADGQVNAEGSVAWVVETYRASDEFAGLAPGTTKYYRRLLNDVAKITPHLPFAAAFTRRAVIEFVNGYSKGMRKQAGAVLRNLFNTALYHGYAVENCARDLRIRSSGRRSAVFSDAEASAWLEQCGNDCAMVMAFNLLRYTVQRPNDVLLMEWSQYDGETIRLRQQKTKKLVEVPCHSALRKALSEARSNSDGLRIVSNRGSALSYTRFNERFRRIADRAGLKNLQARDLRRTAAVKMAEAGATEAQIAAIGGWSIQATRSILETYLPRNIEMAREGIRRWEKKDRAKKG